MDCLPCREPRVGLFGDASDFQRGAELLGSGAFVAGFTQLDAGGDMALSTGLFVGIHAGGSGPRLINQCSAAKIGRAGLRLRSLG